MTWTHIAHEMRSMQSGKEVFSSLFVDCGRKRVKTWEEDIIRTSARPMRSIIKASLLSFPSLSVVRTKFA
jgi:hypothetical protein